ncbi:MAG: hypothetical protein Kow0059_13570 [Candidatus Sumerlaeia bacterium]
MTAEKTKRVWRRALLPAAAVMVIWTAVFAGASGGTGTSRAAIEDIVAGHAALRASGDWLAFSCVQWDEGALLVAAATPESVLRAHLLSLRTSGPHLNYAYNNRLTATSTDGAIQPRQAITITYSFLPDGTIIPGAPFAGDSTSPSELFALLDANFPGGRDAWKAAFAQAFGRWGELTGITFVETADDGAPFPSSAGAVGVRGDVRIGMHPIGPQGAAYNYFPNVSDLVLDSQDLSYWINPYENFRLLRNVVMHEHGHGLGLNHVEPRDHTKLMEAVSGTWFDGPQQDDIRGAQREYGDPSEANDSPAEATDLGTAVQGLNLINHSIEDNALNDYYRFFVPARATLAVTLTPVGTTYTVGPAGGTTAPVDALRIHDLAFQLLASDGSTVISHRNAGGPGEPESLASSSPGEGFYYLRVFATTTTDDVQRYELRIEAREPPTAQQVVDHILERAALTPEQQADADRNANNRIETGDVILAILGL